MGYTCSLFSRKSIFNKIILNVKYNTTSHKKLVDDIPFMAAETSGNHNQSLEQALALVEVAAQTAPIRLR